VLDEARAGGGRIHRRPDSWLEQTGLRQAAATEGETLRAALASCGAELASEHCVWHVGLLPGNADHPPRFEVFALAAVGVRQAQSPALVIATGAIERFYPRPGWTLPGVVGLGAATLMLKASGVLPGRRVAVVGPGALAVSVAKLIVDAGGEVVTVCDPNPLRTWVEALPAMARQPGALARGGAWLAGLALKGVPIYRGWDVRAIHGERSVEGVTLGRVDDQWRPLLQKERTIPADAVCIGYGLAPATDIFQLLGAARRYEPALGGWVPVLDRGQRSDIPGLYGAGDSAGVLGAAAAPGTGRIAALSAALDLGRLDAATYERKTVAERRGLARAASIGSAVSRLVQPRAAAVGWVPDHTVVCRCEDIHAGELRAAIAAGAQELNALKAATRCGMGPCGGRVCGEAAAALLEGAGFSRERSGQFTARPPLRPIPLSALTGSFDYGDIPFPQTADT
jgi:thioredoxin reductase/bacterioferritin-associated ferredoxin